MQEKGTDEIREFVKDLCMLNNKFMNLMLDGNIKAAEVMLRVMLENDKIKVVSVRIQNFIQNLYGHSAQLDILAQDGDGSFFNVEVQRSDEGAQEKRARFYSSVLDTQFLRSNRDYKELPESFVIFITEHDVLKKGLPLYHINRTVKEDGTDFVDGSHIVYVNSNIRDDTPLGRLMQDLYCKDPAKLNYKEFVERMAFLKYSKDGEEKMTDVFEEYAQKRAMVVAREAARKLLHRGVSQEIVADAMNLSLEEVRELLKEEMMHAADLRVRLEVDVHSGSNWYEAK